MTNQKTPKQVVHSVLGQRKSKGATSKEIEKIYNLSHGVVSAALSNLQAKGLVVLLTEKREKYGVYVYPEWAKGRPTRPRKGKQETDECTRPECVSMEQMYFDLLNAKT